MIDPRGIRHEYEYNEVDWRVAEREPSLGYETGYVHDRNGNVVEEIRPVGSGEASSRIVRTYGTLDELLTVSAEVAPGELVSQTLEYDPNLNVDKVTRPAGQVSDATYDARDLLVGLTHTGSGLAVAVPESFGHDADGRRTQYTDGRGKTWITQYDGYGRPMTTQDPLGRATTSEYDDGANPVLARRYDASGCLVTRGEATYDPLGRRTSTSTWAWEGSLAPPDCDEPPPGSRILQSAFTYDGLGNVLSVTDPLGRVAGATYDEADRLTRLQDAAGNVTTFALDELGNVVQETVQELLPGGGVESVVTTHAYDPINRLVETRDGLGNARQLVYDARGNVTVEIDPAGHFTARTYDWLDRMTSETRPEGIGVEYGYDASGRLLLYRDALGNETTWSYDALDRKAGVTYPDATTESYEYDAAGNRTRTIDSLGTVIDQTFDAAGRLASRLVTPAAGVVGPTSESYTWDDADRLAQAVSGGVTTTRTYDSAGRLLSETTNGRTVRHAYDDAGNELALEYPSGLVLGRVFDELNWPSSLGVAGTFPAPGAQTVTVDPFARYGFRGPGLVASKALGFGATAPLTGAMTYDPVRRLIESGYTESAGAGTVFGEALTWDARSLKTGVSRADRNGSSLGFTYDRAGRLTETTRSGGAPGFGLPDGWSFMLDTAQNLLARESRRLTETTTRELPLDDSGRNRPASVDGTTLEWDAAGNLTRKGDLTFAYDYRNRLTEVRDASGLVASYSYDAFNRRVEKAVGATTTETVWTGWQALEDYRNGTLAERRSFGLGLDEVVRVESDVEGDGVLETEYHPLYDSTGNLAMVVGTAGTPIELYGYSPFGERRLSVNDLTPPAVEQVRVVGGSLWIELSEAVDAGEVEGAVAAEEIALTDTGVAQAVPVTAGWPVTDGPQAHRRLVLTPQTAPAEGSAVELTLAAGAVADLFGNATTAATTEGFAWPAGDAVVSDAAAPVVRRVTVEEGRLVVVVSEEPDVSAATVAIQLDGQALTWSLGADRYTLTSAETVPAGSHDLTVGTGALDLAGTGLAAAFQESFALVSGDDGLIVYEEADPTRADASTVGNLRAFHGRPVDTETGFLYFRNRFYDPEMGRFIQVDPMGYGDGPNLYQYALNNPANFFDPLGLAVAIQEEDFEANAEKRRAIQLKIEAAFQAVGRQPDGWIVALLVDSVLAYGMPKDREEQLALLEENLMSFGNPVAMVPGKSQVARVSTKGLRGLVRKLNPAAWFDDLGEAVARGLDEGGGVAGQQLAPRFNLPRGTTVVRHGPLNPGPLADDVVATFRSGSYGAVTTTEPTTLYRVYSDPGRQLRPYWTRTRPSGPTQSIVDSALDPRWGNRATNWVEIRVPAGTTFYEGVTAAQRGLVGGGNQIFLPWVDPRWVVHTGGF